LAFAVGDATRDAAMNAGFVVHSADGDADALIALIRDSNAKGPLIHLRGVHSRGNIAARLTFAGIKTDESVIYDQPELPLNADAIQAIEGKQPVVAPLFSPRTAALLAAYGVKAQLSVAAMSESVAKAAAPLHIRHERWAPRPALIEMQSLTAELLREASCL
jgi:uroporphyrinogen-III synthase